MLGTVAVVLVTLYIPDDGVAQASGARRARTRLLSPAGWLAQNFMGMVCTVAGLFMFTAPIGNVVRRLHWHPGTVVDAYPCINVPTSALKSVSVPRASARTRCPFRR